jgi:hypothetical protein
LYGNGWHWTTTGATSIYNPNYKSFRVYVKGMSHADLIKYEIELHYQIVPQE